MNRVGITAATVFGVLFLLATASFAFAKESGRPENRDQDGISAQLQIQAGVNVERKSESEDANSSEDAKGNDKNEDIQEDENDNLDIGDDENDTEDEGEKHRSDVADIVHSLKALADRDGGIGDEVRKIAQEQASSSEHVAEAMGKVEARSALLSFLFGADFKNLGTLRSELATTENHIKQLTEAKSGAVSADVKAGIDVQISALQKANADASAFVQAHEEVFSIFGWFTRLFN